MTNRTMPFRVAAWVCLLAILLAPALLPTAGAPAILVEADPFFGAMPECTLLCVRPGAPPPDAALASAVPARAPPLA
jgi:hypothetical protein